MKVSLPLTLDFQFPFPDITMINSFLFIVLEVVWVHNYSHGFIKNASEIMLYT